MSKDSLLVNSTQGEIASLNAAINYLNDIVMVVESRVNWVEWDDNGSLRRYEQKLDELQIALSAVHTKGSIILSSFYAAKARSGSQ